jgi:predicted RNA-binding protein with RPS1 domain
MLIDTQITNYQLQVIDYCNDGIIVELGNELQLIPSLYLNTTQNPIELIGDIIWLRLINPGVVPMYENGHIKFFDVWVLSYGIDFLEYYRIGDIIAGTISKIEERGAWVNIGINRQIYIPQERISRSWTNVAEYLPVGTTREFIISHCYTHYPDRESLSNISLSLIELEKSIIDQRLEQMQANNVTIYARTIGYENYRKRILIQIDNLIMGIDSLLLGKIYSDCKSSGITIPLKIIDSKHRILVHPEVLTEIQSGNLYPGEIEKVYQSSYRVKMENGSSILRQSNILDLSQDVTERVSFKVGDLVMVKMIFSQKIASGIEFSMD